MSPRARATRSAVRVVFWMLAALLLALVLSCDWLLLPPVLVGSIVVALWLLAIYMLATTRRGE